MPTLFQFSPSVRRNFDDPFVVPVTPQFEVSIQSFGEKEFRSNIQLLGNIVKVVSIQSFGEKEFRFKDILR